MLHRSNTRFLSVLILVINVLNNYCSFVCSQLKNPNVVFVIFDDLRPALSGYGDRLAKTPNLDRFMEKSFYFTKAYCQQALCAPSRNSLLTGRRPDSLHLYDFYSYWRDFAGNFTTLPQYFKENNYTTYSIGKVFHPGISSNFSDDYPLSWSRKPYHPITEKFMNSPVCPDGTGDLQANLICPIRLKNLPYKTLPDIESIKEAKRFFKHYNSTVPYFLAIGFHKPHIPLKFPKKYIKLFPNSSDFNCSEINFQPDGMPNVAWNPFTDIRRRNDVKKQNISFPFGPIENNFAAKIRQAYYASVSYVDNLFGKLLNIIDTNSTVVIVTGDHGWSLGEHSEWAKYSNFEVAVRIPLIIYSPEFRKNSTRKLENVIELIDLFPTIVDLAKLPAIPACCKHQKKNQDLCSEGRSLYSLLINNTIDDHRYAFSQYPRPSDYPSMNPNSDKPKLRKIRIMGYSLRTAQYRYTLWIAFNGKTLKRNWKKIYGEELYDHATDPQENNNLTNRKEIDPIRINLKNILIKHFK